MLEFLKLCFNENVKLLKRKSTVVFIFIVCISLFLCYIFTKIVIEQVFYPQFIDKSLYENYNAQKKWIEEAKKNIIKFQNNEKELNIQKVNLYYYQYATDHNINLYPITIGSVISDYWKSDIIYKLIELKKQWYKFQDSKDDSQKFDEVSKKIESLTKMLQNDDYNKYLDFKRVDYEEQYKNGKITVYQRDIDIYLLDLNKKYETTRYNDSSNWWKYNSIYVIQQPKNMLLTGRYTISLDDKIKFNEQINTEIYRLEHNIAINNLGLTNYNDLYIQVCEKVVIAVLAIYIIIIAGESITSEFSKGTIKQVLMTPNKRWKVLLSKVVVLTVVLVIFSIILSLIVQLFGNIFFGQHVASHYVYESNGQIKVINNVIYNVLRFLIRDIRIFMYMLFTFMLGVILRNTAIVTGISVFIYAGEEIFMQLVNDFLTKQEWIKFIPFNNFNLVSRIFPNESLNGFYMYTYNNITLNSITLNFSIGVILVCSFLLLTIAFDSFNKKEI